MVELASCLLIPTVVSGWAWCSTDPISWEHANAAISRTLPFVQLGLRCDRLFGIGTDFCTRKQRANSRNNSTMRSCK